MKLILKSIVLFFSVILCSGVFAQSKEKTNDKFSTIVLSSQISCQNCKNKIEKNIPFEKGVKDLKVDIEKKTVTITFRKDKNTAEALCAAVSKLGYKSVIIEER